MAVIAKGKVYVDGLYVGSAEESNRPIKDGVVNVNYEDRPRKYVVKTRGRV